MIILVVPPHIIQFHSSGRGAVCGSAVSGLHYQIELVICGGGVIDTKHLTPELHVFKRSEGIIGIKRSILVSEPSCRNLGETCHLGGCISVVGAEVASRAHQIPGAGSAILTVRTHTGIVVISIHDPVRLIWRCIYRAHRVAELMDPASELAILAEQDYVLPIYLPGPVGCVDGGICLVVAP